MSAYNWHTISKTIHLSSWLMYDALILVNLFTWNENRHILGIFAVGPHVSWKLHSFVPAAVRLAVEKLQRFKRLSCMILCGCDLVWYRKQVQRNAPLAYDWGHTLSQQNWQPRFNRLSAHNELLQTAAGEKRLWSLIQLYIMKTSKKISEGCSFCWPRVSQFIWRMDLRGKVASDGSKSAVASCFNFSGRSIQGGPPTIFKLAYN